MTDLTTAALSTEILDCTLLTLEQVSTSLTVFALDASTNPEQSPRVRALLDDLLVLIQQCENDLGTYAATNRRLHFMVGNREEMDARLSSMPKK